MRLIDAKNMEKHIKEAFDGNPFLMGMLLRWIRKQPTIDAVSVIRCKQCCFWDESKKGFSDECLCKRWSTEGVADYFTEPESFCSYADMKD